MIKVSITGMVVSLKTDLRFPIPGQQGHEGRIIQLPRIPTYCPKNFAYFFFFVLTAQMIPFPVTGQQGHGHRIIQIKNYFCEVDLQK